MSIRDIIGALLIVLVLSGAGAAFYVAHDLSRPQFDEATLCPLSGVEAATVVVIDTSDPLAQDQIASLHRRVMAERDRLTPGSIIKIAAIERSGADESGRIRVLRGLCNPGSEANPLYQNARMVQARYRQAFLEPLARDLAAMLSNKEAASQSPIAEAVAAAIIPDKNVLDAKMRRLILVSDLLEHSSIGSAYAGTFDARSLDEALAARLGPWLRGATVLPVIIAREGEKARQQKAYEVWKAFFEKAGAKLEERQEL